MKEITSVVLFEKIKEISRRTLDPRHPILCCDIALELSMEQDAQLLLLIELQNRGLVKIHNSMVNSVSLTNYGVSQHAPPSGFESACD